MANATGRTAPGKRNKNQRPDDPTAQMRIVPAFLLAFIAATGHAQTLPHHRQHRPVSRTTFVGCRRPHNPAARHAAHSRIYAAPRPAPRLAGRRSDRCRRGSTGKLLQQYRVRLPHRPRQLHARLTAAKYSSRPVRMHAKRALSKARRASSPRKERCSPATAAGIRASATAC